MRLKLTVDVPNSVDAFTLQQLLGSALREEGITITTSRQVNLDVDLVDVERVAKPGQLQEVPG